MNLTCWILENFLLNKLTSRKKLVLTRVTDPQTNNKKVSHPPKDDLVIGPTSVRFRTKIGTGLIMITYKFLSQGISYRSTC
jgi:hypothetical protein